MGAQTLRAPKADGAILADPPLDSAADALAANARRFDGWDHDFQGRSYRVLRSKAREDALAAARRYHEDAGIDLPEADGPFVVTGHQPELFHPGVWVKNFAVGAIAAGSGGLALNLIVDNDIPKGASIRVPYRSGSALRTSPVAFDAWTGEVPFEDQPIRDAALFASFPSRVRERLGDLVADPLVERFWRHVESARPGMTAHDRVGRRFARARRLVEAEWGLHNWEVPLSDICETDGFRWFASHVLAHLARFRSVHNAALARYRAAHGIRSKNHPVAALGGDGAWQEAPFWAWRQSEPRRRPVWVRQNRKTMDLRIGGEEMPFIELPLAADREACCAVERLRDLPGLGVRLRTRALTTTMYARFLLGDLFVHGIGGAKYDELGDEIAHEFFGITPPRFVTLSMTLHLGLPTAPATPDDLGAVGRGLRDLDWQPERFADGDDRLVPLMERKRQLVAEEPTTKAGRLARYRAIREVNASLGRDLGPRREALARERIALAAALQDNTVARSREYASVLYDEARIRLAMARVGPTGPAREGVAEIFRSSG